MVLGLVSFQLLRRWSLVLALITAQVHLQATVLTSVADPDPSDPYVFGPPGSGSTNQIYGSADPDPHQNVMDPQHWF
jgi:hypothetical protein